MPHIPGDEAGQLGLADAGGAIKHGAIGVALRVKRGDAFFKDAAASLGGADEVADRLCVVVGWGHGGVVNAGEKLPGP